MKDIDYVLIFAVLYLYIYIFVLKKGMKIKFNEAENTVTPDYGVNPDFKTPPFIGNYDTLSISKVKSVVSNADGTILDNLLGSNDYVIVRP